MNINPNCPTCETNFRGKGIKPSEFKRGLESAIKMINAGVTPKCPNANATPEFMRGFKTALHEWMA